jgi:iron-sulfur cluster assembly accessory protein
MSIASQPELALTVTPVAVVEVKKFMDAEGVSYAQGGLRVSVQPGGCSGFKYGLLIEDPSAEDDLVLEQECFKVFVDPFSGSQYISVVTIDYVTSMQGSVITFKNPERHGRLRLRQLLLGVKTTSHDNPTVTGAHRDAGTAIEARDIQVNPRAFLRVPHHAASRPPSSGLRTIGRGRPRDIALARANRIATLIREKAGGGRAAVLGLATGSTPIGVYRELIRCTARRG